MVDSTVVRRHIVGIKEEPFLYYTLVSIKKIENQQELASLEAGDRS